MKLYFFTFAFPYGNTISWKTVELEHFSPAFSSIDVIPFTFREPVEKNIPVPGNVKFHKPLFDPAKKPFILVRLYRLFTGRNRKYFIDEFYKKKVYKNFRHFTNWAIESYHLHQLLENPLVQELGKASDEKTIWYFYWGQHPALLIPYIKKHFKGKIACRFHGYDLYEEQQHGYIPYQDKIIEHCDLLLPCSTNGKNHLVKKHIVNNEKIFVARLGTRSAGIAPLDKNSILKIASCSDVVPVKRLDLLIEAIGLLDIPVSWMHMGDGENMWLIKQRAVRLNKEDLEIEFTGYISNNEVMKNLSEIPFDVFVNVSRSEGVPVSIMEAFSAGIPAIATNVGGTGELVNSFNGILVNQNISAKELAGVLKSFHQLDEATVIAKRNAALETFKRMADADINAQKLLDQLIYLLKDNKPE